jgi:hypothetical protein
MPPQTTTAEARAALDAVERGRLRVVEEIDLPAWYWWGLALGWVALGLVNDLTDDPWATSVATLAFGAVHAAVAARVLQGRSRTPQLRVRRDVAEGARTARLVIAALVALGALTVGAALLADADGAGHPATTASVLVAVVIVLGGPRLLATVRRRAAGRTWPA